MFLQELMLVSTVGTCMSQSLNTLSLFLSQIWPCSWTRGSLSTTAPAGETAPLSFPSNPYPSFSTFLWSSSIKACHILLVVASSARTYCLPQEPVIALGKQAHPCQPLRVSAVIYLFLSPSLSPFPRAPILLLMLEIYYVGRSGLL